MAQERERPKWIDYFFEIVNIVASRATCETQREGCVIVREYRPIATGYAGSMPGEAHCDDVGHCFDAIARIGEKDDPPVLDSKVYHIRCARVVGAVQNAIMEAARHGISLDGSDIFCTRLPDAEEAKMIVLCGISRVYYEAEGNVNKEFTNEIFSRAGLNYFKRGEVEYVTYH